MPLTLDHVVFGCSALEAGAADLADIFGAAPAGWGVHAMMGTHNALWNMGDAYVELVAINPGAPHPGRPRWFGLDDAGTQARLAEGPRLLTWAMAGPEIGDVALRAPVPFGPLETFARDDLSWQVGMPKAGTPGLDGILPLFLHWIRGLHPARRLGDQGLRCTALRLSHPDIQDLEKAAGPLPSPVSGCRGAPQITLEMETPNGSCRFTAFE